MRRSPWTRGLATFLALAGLVAVAAGAWWPAPDEVATATHGGGAPAEERRVEPDREAWRDALLVAGGVCLAAAAGLLLLTLLPRRAGRG